jgi:hypothetical protein
MKRYVHINSKQEPCQHGHPPPNVFAHVYVVEQNNSILRGLLVMKTDGQVITDFKPMWILMAENNKGQ